MQKNSHKKSSRKKFLSWFANFWPILAIVAAVLIFFYPVWLKGLIPLPADIVVGSYYPWLDYKWGYPTGVPVKNPITSDAISFSFPMRILAIDLLKSGQWPLWNPYILFGTPLLANFQSAPFSPTNFVYLLTDKLTGWTLQIILQHALAAVFTYLLLRNWRVSKTSSIFGGIIFSFSGFSLIWSQWNAHALTAAFIPLVILFVDRWGRFNNWWAGTGISLTLALQLFSGYPQVIFYALAAVLVFWLVVFWKSKNYFRKTILLLIFIFLGFGLSSLQILPAYELVSLSQRKTEGIPLEWVFLSWEQIITFLAPDFFGNHATGNYWGSQNYTSVIGFVGVISVVLAIFTLFLWRQKREVRFLVSLVLLSLLFAFPTPIALLVWQANPFGIQAGVSSRALVLFTLAIALMAAIGVDHILRDRKASIKIPVLIPAVVLIMFLSYGFFGVQEAWKSHVAMRNLALPFTSLFSVFVLLVLLKDVKVPKQIFILGFFTVLIVELFYFGWKFTPFTPRDIAYPQTPVVNFLSKQEKPFRFDGGDVVPANLFMPYKLEGISGYDAVYPFRTAKLMGVMNSNNTGARPQDRYGIVTNTDSPLQNLINAKYLLVKTDKFDKINQEKYIEVFNDRSVAVLERKDVLPRAFMVYEWETVNNKEGVLGRLLDPNFPASKKIILEDSVLIDRSIKPNSSDFGTQFIEYKEQESKLKVVTPENGFLFVSDTWYPGWKAFVDNKEVKIHKANYAFRAVSVPAGEHEVRFIYKPDSFYTGIKLSGVSFITLLLLPLFLKWKHKWIS